MSILIVYLNQCRRPCSGERWHSRYHLCVWITYWCLKHILHGFKLFSPLIKFALRYYKTSYKTLPMTCGLTAVVWNRRRLFPPLWLHRFHLSIEGQDGDQSMSCLPLQILPVISDQFLESLLKGIIHTFRIICRKAHCRPFQNNGSPTARYFFQSSLYAHTHRGWSHLAWKGPARNPLTLGLEGAFRDQRKQQSQAALTGLSLPIRRCRARRRSARLPANYRLTTRSTLGPLQTRVSPVICQLRVRFPCKLSLLFQTDNCVIQRTLHFHVMHPIIHWYPLQSSFTIMQSTFFSPISRHLGPRCVHIDLQLEYLVDQTALTSPTLWF